jgi:REP-associated tyrosine transposase
MRRSLRLPHFDYASSGVYFVTITVNERAALLGSTAETMSGVELSDAGKMVEHWFKTMTTAEYFRSVRSHSWPRVTDRLWQRSFYDHVIRTEQDLVEIRNYIERNPGALFERYAGADTWVRPSEAR